MIALNAAAISLLGAVRPLQAEEVLQEPDTTITHKAGLKIKFQDQVPCISEPLHKMILLETVTKSLEMLRTKKS